MKRKSKCLSLTLCSHFHVSLKVISLLMGLLSLFRWYCGRLDYNSCTTWQEKSVGSAKPVESENDPRYPNVDPVSTDFWYWWYLEWRCIIQILIYSCLICLLTNSVHAPGTPRFLPSLQSLWKFLKIFCLQQGWLQASEQYRCTFGKFVWCIAYGFFHVSCSWISHL